MPSILVLILCVYFTQCWLFEDEHKKPRDLDGSLRCYQCNTEETEAGPGRPTCSLNNWVNINATQKRQLVMQCLRSKSAFCFLMVTQGTGHTARGCSGPEYTSGQKAHVGCFNMVDPKDDSFKRVCMCDTTLCNASAKLPNGFYWITPLLMGLKTIYFYWLIVLVL